MTSFAIFSKKSLSKNRKKYYEEVRDYNLHQLGMSHSDNSVYDRSATASGVASEFSRIPNNHPILTVIFIFIIGSIGF